jgi:hypothetical protein
MPITYIVGGIVVLLAVGIFVYNWEYPIDEEIPSLSEAIKNSRVVWGF